MASEYSKLLLMSSPFTSPREYIALTWSL